jgi:protein pelota
MKIILKDMKHKILKVRIDNNEDSWYLSNIIEPDDLVSGMTERKIKLGGTEDKSRILKRIIHLKIRVEKLDDENSVLRVSGPIIEAPDDIPKGDFHTFALDQGSVVTIEKEHWTAYSLKKLDEAAKNDKLNILVVAFDREEAIFALLKNQGYDILLDLKGDVSKKDLEEKKSNFYSEIYKQIKAYDEREGFSSIVLASPAFWKEYLLKEFDDDALRKKITLAACSSIDEGTINEILKRPELKTVLEKDRSSKESRLIEELLDDIRKDNAAYGIKQVKEKIVAGNVSALLVSENLVRKMKSEKIFDQIDLLMNDAESLGADIRIISSDDAAKKLDGLSGIAAILRWKENY